MTISAGTTEVKNMDSLHQITDEVVLQNVFDLTFGCWQLTDLD